MRIERISKIGLSHLYKVRVDVLDMMIRHLHLPPRSEQDEFSEAELELIFKDVGSPFTRKQ